MPSGLANHPAVAREAADLKKKNITTTDGALQNMLSRGIDPYLAQAVVSQMQMQAAAPLQNIRPPQGTVVDKTLGIGLPAMQGAQNVGAQGFAHGGIVAFTPENPGNDGQLVNGDEGDDEDFASRVGRSAAAQNAAIGEGILNYGKNALYSTVAPGPYLVDKFRKLLKKDPDTGRYYLGSKPDHTYRSDKEAWADFSKNTQGIMSGITPSAEELKNAPKERVTHVPRIAPKNIADFMQRAADWKHGLSPAPTSLEGSLPPFAMGPQSPIMSGNAPAADDTAPVPPVQAPGGPSRVSSSAAGKSPVTDIQKEIDARSKALDEKKMQDEEFALQEKAGVGNAANSLADFMKQYAGKALTKEGNKKQAVIDAGLAMLSAGSERGATFLGSVGAGAKAGVTGYRERDKEQEKKAFDLAKATYDVESAREAQKYNAYKEGSKKYQHEKDKIFELQKEQITMSGRWAIAQLEAGNQAAYRKSAQMAGIPEPLWGTYYKWIDVLNKKGANDPEAKKLQDTITTGMSATSGVMRANIAAEAGTQRAGISARQKAMAMLGTPMQVYDGVVRAAQANPGDEKAQQRLAQQQASLKRTLSMNGFNETEIAEILGGGAGSVPSNGVEFMGFK